MITIHEIRPTPTTPVRLLKLLRSVVRPVPRAMDGSLEILLSPSDVARIDAVLAQWGDGGTEI